MSAASAIILGAGHPQARAERDTAALSALAAWRATQGIYRIHPTLLAELMDTPEEKEQPHGDHRVPAQDQAHPLG